MRSLFGFHNHHNHNLESSLCYDLFGYKIAFGYNPNLYTFLTINVHFFFLYQPLDGIDHTKYPTILFVVKAALILAYGNGEVDRGFSDSGKTITVDRTHLSEASVNNLQIAAGGLKVFVNLPHHVPFTFIYKGKGSCNPWISFQLRTHLSLKDICCQLNLLSFSFNSISYWKIDLTTLHV